MKKKTIEKIPYLGLGKVKREKTVRYVGVTALMDVAGKEHFFLEVYRNRRDRKDIPVARIVFSGEDFATYLPGKGEWTRQACVGKHWFIWDEAPDDRVMKSSGTEKEENVLCSVEDMERMEGYFCDSHVRDRGQWWEYVRYRQHGIVSREVQYRRERKKDRRQQALADRIRDTPGLPEASILEYADRRIFRNHHYLYYKKTGSRAEVACSACGRIHEGRWRPGETWESQFEQYVQEPRENYYGTCPLCGAAGKYVPQGRAKGVHTKRGYLFLGQKYRETGMVFRYVRVDKEYRLDMAAGEKGLEMLGAGEGLYGIEIARAYFEEGRKPQTDYHKHNGWTGEDFWDDCNLSGMANITVKEALVMPETYGNLQGTFLQYSALREYQEAAGVVNPFRYMDRYISTPQIEMLVKLGLTEVVGKLLRYEYGIVADGRAACVDGFLGIRKEKVGLLRKQQGNLELLRVLQMEKRMGQNWTDEQAGNLAETGLEIQEIHTALQYMTVQKLLNRIRKYAGCEFGTGCSHAVERLRQTARYYLDYLDMRIQLGYSLENTVYQQPGDLQAAHDRMVHESSRREQDDRLKEVSVRFPLIRKHYRKLRKRYFYEDEKYRIRPARSAEEIVMEGRILHHCVGGDSYLGKHDRGESVILFLRSREAPETPYITVEIGKGCRILQWYGAHDKKPDRENMQKWLDAYVTRLKCGTMEAGTAGTDVHAAVTA